MIILSGILVVLAIALLVAGIVAGADGVGGVQGLTLIYVSIAISIVSALCLAIGVFLRRKELFGTAVSAVPTRSGKPAKSGKPGRTVRQAKGAKESVGPVPDETGDETVALSSLPLEVPSDATVWVVRGRKRYHLETCRQLSGRDKEDLTYAEAGEEGFSPCTACMPDTALAARAAASSPESAAEGVGAAGGPRSKDTSAEPASESVAARPAAGDVASDTSSAVASSPWDDERQLDTPSWALSPTERSVATRAERLPAPRTEEAATAEFEAVDKDATSSADETPEDAPSSVWTTTPVAPSAFDLPAEAEESPLVLEFSATEPASAGSLGTTAKSSGTSATWADDEPAVESPLPDPLGDETAGRPADAEDDASPSEGTTADLRAADDEESEPVAPEGDRPDSPQVRILSGTRRYHRPDCALIEDIGDEAEDLDSLSRDEAKERGCTPCLVCQPDKEHAED